MTRVTIAAAAYPLDFHDTFDSYATKVTAWVSEAAASGAALLVFPEYGAMELGSLGGRAVAGDLEACLHEVARWKPQVDALHCALAARFGVHILGASGPVFLPENGNDIYTSAGQTDPKRNAVYTSGPRPVNRSTLYGPGGILGHQDKQIMTRFERETWFVEPGHGLRVFDTPLGRLGVVTCQRVSAAVSRAGRGGGGDSAGALLHRQPARVYPRAGGQHGARAGESMRGGACPDRGPVRFLPGGGCECGSGGDLWPARSWLSRNRDFRGNAAEPARLGDCDSGPRRDCRGAARGRRAEPPALGGTGRADCRRGGSGLRLRDPGFEDSGL